MERFIAFVVADIVVLGTDLKSSMERFIVLHRQCRS